MINWNKLLRTDNDKIVLREFASGAYSGRTLYHWYANTSSGGVARNLLRDHGVTYARRLARKALRRRGVSIDN